MGTELKSKREQKRVDLIEGGLSGAVKFYDQKKGWGVIRADGNRGEFYVHHSGLARKRFPELEENERVSFDVVHGEKGPKCANVVVEN